MSDLPLFECGPSPYFHGREKILQTFTGFLNYYKKEKGGTIFLIEGGSGAGKTALLYQCEKIVQKKWATVAIPLTALWDANQLAYSIKNRTSLQISEDSGQVGMGGIVNANAKSDVAVKRSSLLPVLKTLQRGRKPLLLILDEAHILGKKDIVPPDQKGIVASILNMIHNGKLGRAVMLLVAGLGTTQSAIRSFGIERFVRKCIIQLGSLDKATERSVIHDWLTKHAKAEGDPTAWIDAITEQTYGWPRHIISYVDPAIKYIESNNGQMTEEGLEFVLERGAELRQEFYDSRAHDIDEDKRRALARSISDLPLGENICETAIMSGLMDSGLSHDEADALFHQALEQGIIVFRNDGRYGIPIPSMQTWLLNQYG